MWNYWLGGKDNYPVDEQAGDRIRAVMPGIGDTARAVRGFLVRAVRYLVSGSYLVMSHFTSLVDTEIVEEGMRIYNESGGTPPVRGRSRQELIRYFDRLELREPGLVSVSLWRPDPCNIGTPTKVYEFRGPARKP